MNWPIYFFQTTRGNYPVKDFIEEQELPTATKITHSIELLENYGPHLKAPYSKKLHHSLYELRIPGKVAVRILYTFVHNQFYLLHAFKKKSQKTPPKELSIGLDRMKEVI